MKPEDLTDLSRFLNELQTESDRGLALVGASVLDDKLEQRWDRSLSSASQHLGFSSFQMLRSPHSQPVPTFV